MAKKDLNPKAPSTGRAAISAQPRLHQRADEIQAYGTVRTCYLLTLRSQFVWK
jgi:hypothetical protein